MESWRGNFTLQVNPQDTSSSQNRILQKVHFTDWLRQALAGQSSRWRCYWLFMLAVFDKSKAKHGQCVLTSVLILLLCSSNLLQSVCCFPLVTEGSGFFSVYFDFIDISNHTKTFQLNCQIRKQDADELELMGDLGEIVLTARANQNQCGRV